MRQPLILMDIECQVDFFQPGGALYRREHNVAAGNVYRLFDWAKGTGAAVMSTVLLVRPGHRGPFGLKPHLVEGSGGEAKLPRTLLAGHVNLGLGHNTDVPLNVLDEHPQVIFEKRDPNIFAHPRAERLITELPRDRTFVICGAGTVQGIKQAVIGLRTRGYPVIVAEDAMIDLADSMAEMVWLQMLAKEARPMPTAQIIEEFAPARRRRRTGATHA